MIIENGRECMFIFISILYYYSFIMLSIILDMNIE